MKIFFLVDYTFPKTDRYGDSAKSFLVIAEEKSSAKVVLLQFARQKGLKIKQIWQCRWDKSHAEATYMDPTDSHDLYDIDVTRIGETVEVNGSPAHPL